MSTRTPPPLLAVEGHGAVTCIGHSSAQTVASWLTQVRKLSRVRVAGHHEPFTVAACQDLPPALDEPGRLLAMLNSAVAEAEQQHGPGFGVSQVWLLLPPGLHAATVEALRQAAAGDSAAPASVRVLLGGCTLAAVALEEAFQAVQAQGLRIAAVDSLCLQSRLAQAADAGLLHQPGNAEGLVPGEAAACVDLRRVAGIRAARAGQFALHRPALAEAPSRWWPTKVPASHHPLLQALQAALRHAGMQGRHISHLVSDMDGSSWGRSAPPPACCSGCWPPQPTGTTRHRSTPPCAGCWTPPARQRPRCSNALLIDPASPWPPTFARTTAT